MDWVKSIIYFIESIMRDGGVWVVFIVATIEAFPLIGSLIPGHIVIILGGFLANLGIMDLTWTLIFSAMGAILGDLMGYALGRKYGANWIDRYGKFFYVKKEHVEKARDLLHKHTGKALIVGRFSPITRALMPFFAGVGDVKASTFWLYNVIGGTLWSASSVMIGYLAGASYMVVAGYIGHYLFWGLVYIVLIVWAYVFLEKREHIFSRRHLSTLILAISSLFLFFRLLQDAFFDKLQLSQLDVNFNIFIRSIASDNLILLSNFFSNLFDYKAVIVYSILIILYWSWRNKHLFVYFYLFSVGGGILIGSIFKNFVERIRPDDALLGLTDFSFPSGHSLVVVVILGTLAYYVHRSRMGAHVRAFLYGTFSIIVFAVASSRLILSVHWLTDVIAGLTLGVFWVSFSVLIFHVLGKQEERWLEEYYERFPRRRRLDK